MGELTPYLAVADARAAIDWYARALGAVVTFQPIVMPDDRVGHVELSVGGARFMMADAHPEIHADAPDPARGAAVTLHLTVDDVDALTEQARQLGATVDRGPEDNPPVGRVSVLRDPFGHRWFLNQPTPDEPAGPTQAHADVATSPVWAGDDRVPIPRLAGEREALLAYLEHYRRTIELKCEGLSREQLDTASVPPSTMTLHGLLRHLAGVERWWFQQNFAGSDVPMLYYTDANPDLDFDVGTDDPADALRAWHEECETSRRLVADAALEQTGHGVRGDFDFNLRWLLLRMISEYAQHCGHADLLRERVDGRTGA